MLHAEDRWLWDHAPLQAALFGWKLAPLAAPPGTLVEGQTVAFGTREARVLHTPGHSPGSVCFLLEGGPTVPIVMSGDTLFRKSVGRTDLWKPRLDSNETKTRSWDSAAILVVDGIVE